MIETAILFAAVGLATVGLYALFRPAAAAYLRPFLTALALPVP